MVSLKTYQKALNLNLLNWIDKTLTDRIGLSGQFVIRQVNLNLS